MNLIYMIVGFDLVVVYLVFKAISYYRKGI